MSNIIIDSFRFGASSPATPSLGYGLLYNWYAATDARGVAPSGFRVPTNSEIQVLADSLGGKIIAGGKLKSTRTDPTNEPRWDSPNSGATNESFFKALPSGLRGGGGTFSNLGLRIDLQTSDAVGNTELWSIQSDSAQLLDGAFFNAKDWGRSIRCVSDTEPATTLVQDADGNSYSWVQIGSQYWLVQSLRTTKYNNGDSIVTGLDNAAWAATTDGAWAYPNGDSSLPI